MVIKKVSVRAFKSLNEVSLHLDPRINILIGANESGKTNLLKSIEAFRPNQPFDPSLTCQYAHHYYSGKNPEITLEWTGLSRENKHALGRLSESFREADSFQICRSGPAWQDYRLFIDQQPIANVDSHGLIAALPQVLYFDDIRLLKNRIDKEQLLAATAEFNAERNLLKIGGLDPCEALFEDSARSRKMLEEAGRLISEQLRRVWTQEPSLEVKLNVNGHSLYIDFSDRTTVFDTPESRSLGFRWFLSFYIHILSQTYEGQANEYIFLIDEPGIHLHPAGQRDLVGVLEDLAMKNQIIYTTHSPFMINREHPERVSLVIKDSNGTRVDQGCYRQNWKPLRSELGLKVGDLFFFSDSSLILELPFGKKFGFLDKWFGHTQ